MNYQFAVSEKEAIRFYFPRSRNNFLHFFRLQCWKVVDELPSIGRARYDETEGEVVRSDHFTTEIMPFDHFHVLDGFVTNAKVEGEANGLKVKKLRTQMVLNDSRRWIIIVTNIIVNILLGHLY